jgi:hypothetical protein
MWGVGASCGAIIHRALTCVRHALTSRLHGVAPQHSLRGKKKSVQGDVTNYEQFPSLTRYPQAGGFSASELPGGANGNKVQSGIVTTPLLHRQGRTHHARSPDAECGQKAVRLCPCRMKEGVLKQVLRVVDVKVWARWALHLCPGDARYYGGCHSPCRLWGTTTTTRSTTATREEYRAEGERLRALPDFRLQA